MFIACPLVALVIPFSRVLWITMSSNTIDLSKGVTYHGSLRRTQSRQFCSGHNESHALTWEIAANERFVCQTNISTRVAGGSSQSTLSFENYDRPLVGWKARFQKSFFFFPITSSSLNCDFWALLSFYSALLGTPSIVFLLILLDAFSGMQCSALVCFPIISYFCTRISDKQMCHIIMQPFIFPNTACMSLPL